MGWRQPPRKITTYIFYHDDLNLRYRDGKNRCSKLRLWLCHYIASEKSIGMRALVNPMAVHIAPVKSKVELVTA